LDDAKERLKQLTVMFPGNYFIFDVENACFVIPCDREPAKPLAAQSIPRQAPGRTASLASAWSSSEFRRICLLFMSKVWRTRNRRKSKGS
jgi:hypothetical protein